MVSADNPPLAEKPLQGLVTAPQSAVTNTSGNKTSTENEETDISNHNLNTVAKEGNKDTGIDPGSVTETPTPSGKHTDRELMEIDKISFHTSSLNGSRDTLNSIDKDDSLFRSSENKWDIPALNTSKLMNRSGFGSKDQRENLRKLLQSKPGGDSFRSIRTSTPVVAVMKKTSPLKTQQETKQKVALDLLLNKV